jgi:hypothetical protein
MTRGLPLDGTAPLTMPTLNAALMNAHPDAPDTPDAATWARISPLLDEALDLPAA